MNNFLLQYVEYAAELTAAPLLFHHLTALSILSSTIGRKPYYLLGDNHIFPNLWIILIAPSSEFYKSTAISIGRNLLEEKLKMPHEFSGEAILKHLENSPEGCFFFDEFTTLLGLLNKEYNAGTKAMLTSFYDSPFYYHRTLKKEEIEIKDIFINFLCATTKDWVLKNIQEADMRAGFLARFLFIPALKKEKEMPLPPGVDERKKNHLKDILKIYQTLKFQRMTLSSDSVIEYTTFYHQHKSGISLLDAFYSRLKIYCLKFAMLFQIDFDLQYTIDIASMRKAIQLTKYLSKQLDLLYSQELTFNKFEAQQLKIFKIINQKKKISHSDLLRLIRMPTFELKTIVDFLLQTEKIFISEEKADKKFTKYYNLIEVNSSI